LSLVLLIAGKSLLNDFETVDSSMDGLFIISDSGDDFALCAVAKD